MNDCPRERTESGLQSSSIFFIRNGMVTFGIITILAVLFYMDTFIWNTKIVTIYKDGSSNKTAFQRQLIEWSDKFWPFWLSIPGKIHVRLSILAVQIQWIFYILSKKK